MRFESEKNIIERAEREQAEVWAELDALRAENERLRTAMDELAEASGLLRDVVEHENGCVGNTDWRTPGTDCSCGMFSVFTRFDNALSEAVGR